MKRLILALAVLLPSLAFADSQTVGGQWKGLNNGDATLFLNDNSAQDLSNVDITPNGYGVKKRDGMATFKSLTVATGPVRGGYFYRDGAGVDTLIHAHDVYVSRSVSGGTYTNIATTGSLGAYWDFTDSQGFLYGANSSNDVIWRTSSTVLTYYPSSPRGTQVEFSPDRFIVAGTSTSPNTVYFSGLVDPTNFTLGVLSTSSFTESFGLPGQKTTAIKYAMGRLFHWTKDTFSQWTGTSQFDGDIQDISGTIGTLQPNSVVFDQNILYWQGQDGHFYNFDGNGINWISRDISGSVSGFARGQSNDWTQTDQSDFAAGTTTGTSTSFSPGNVVLATFSVTETAASVFALGTLTNSNTTYASGSVTLSTNNVDVPDGDFETGTLATNWDSVNYVLDAASHAGSWAVKQSAGNFIGTLELKIMSSTGTLSFKDITVSGSGWHQYSYDISAWVGRNIKIKFLPSTSPDFSDSLTSKNYFLCSGGTITFWALSTGGVLWIDDIQGGRSTIYSGSYASQRYNTALSPIILSTLTYTGSGVASTVSTIVNATTGFFTINFATTDAETALPSIQDATYVLKASTGSFVSQVKDFGTVASWNNFTRTQTLNDGAISYAIRTAATSGGLSAASWVWLTPDAQITAATNEFAQVMATFTITAATQAPTLSAFTVSWNDGAITRTYGTVDKYHRILWSVAEGTATTTNVTYIYDPRFDSWLKYSKPIDAPAKSGDYIYFGGPSNGTIYKYPSGTSDYGNAINAYWKSKDFVSADPYSEKNYLALSMVAKSYPASSLDFTYTVNTSTSATYSISLADANSNTLIRNNRYLPHGLFGTFFSFQFGNNAADSPFEVYTVRLDYFPRPWRVLP